MNYALNYVRSGHWSGSELKKDPGARLPDLKVSIIPSILPANDLAIDPFHPVSAASPASCDDGVLAQTRRSRLFRRHGDVPSTASEQASERRRSSRSSSTSTGSPPYFSCLMRTTRLGAATDRSSRACDKRSWGVHVRAQQDRFVPSVSILPSRIDLVLCVQCLLSAPRSVCLLDDIAVIVSWPQSKHRTLMLIYKRMNDAPATLLPTTLIRVPHANRIDVETLRASFGDSSTETAQADTCLPVFDLKRVARPKGAFERPA
ncbi:hypothetical protein EDB85DRAFT_2151559 [Lactarius pseudohatsudake]|nr:hypothetical protein EDB85DRAFT_2151559 [Lactarius pseudohatsudake]